MPDVESDTAARADLALMLDVVREAGDLSVQWLKRGARTWDKSPNNPVTEADIAVNELIQTRLGQARPGYGWISEETPETHTGQRAQRSFVVDPIDGTRAFVKGEPAFAVSIARMELGRPVAGVVFNPMTDELFAGGPDGATLNGQPLQVSTAASLETSRLIGHADLFDREPGRPDAGMTFLRPIPSSIAYRLCLVASGRWDGLIRLLSIHDWDIAAAVQIVAAAGGVVTDRDGGELRFNRPNPVQPGVVAAGAGLHPLLMERLKPAGRDA